MGELSKALPLYEEALRRQPEWLVARQKLGEALRLARAPDRAAAVLRPALGTAPGSYEMGMVYLNQGRAQEAIAGLPDGSFKVLAQAVESAAGLFNAGDFRGSSGRLIGMTWGPEDLSAELGAESNRDAQGKLTEPYRLARSICLFGAAAAKVPAIETVYVDFRDSDGLRRDTEDARRVAHMLIAAGA